MSRIFYKPHPLLCMILFLRKNEDELASSRVVSGPMWPRNE